MSDQAAQQHCQDLAAEVLKLAKQLGASAADVSVGTDQGFSTNVRMGKVETLEYNRNKSLAVTVYFGQRTGSASSSDTSPEAIKSTVEAACNIAKFTQEDDCAGLASSELMAYDYPDLDLCHPWELTPEQAIEQAIECEAVGLEADKRITNSEGATISTNTSYSVYANSHGFTGAYATSRQYASCVLVAGQEDTMERDYYYTTARDAADLLPLSEVAKKAAERTVRRLGAEQLKTQRLPVIFSADLARGLLGAFISAIKGSNIYRGASFLVDHVGKQVFPEFVTIGQQPHLKKALGSAPYDAEGVATQNRVMIQDGWLQSYVLGSYSARKLGVQTTGNAGGVFNLSINSGEHDLNGLLKQMGTGILVTELIGHGTNLVTGDYSQGAWGFWVENGEIQYPFDEVTIAGNLAEMFKGLVAVGSDVDRRGSVHSGSWLIDGMTIAGR